MLPRDVLRDERGNGIVAVTVELLVLDGMDEEVRAEESDDLEEKEWRPPFRFPLRRSVINGQDIRSGGNHSTTQGHANHPHQQYRGCLFTCVDDLGRIATASCKGSCVSSNGSAILGRKYSSFVTVPPNRRGQKSEDVSEAAE